eukprot:CAMPEP_0171417508 /NCGR_PEP_ID=MMETSP0880-20121228/40637_1 /TAXON_ID=67004 /ORGANISM="Thalassiosira weissflogii, Strain CCMP1336" /LENGTH=833 /DNA_ID=CAMNT_0011935767 /DNA_START=32 /DNA_END=2533 /DNA_ORIENTATION=+
MNSRQTDDELMRLPPRRVPTSRTPTHSNSPLDGNISSPSSRTPAPHDDEPGAIVSASTSFSRSDSGGSSRHVRSPSQSSDNPPTPTPATVRAIHPDLEGLETEFQVARSRSAHSPRDGPSPPASAFRDRPWRTDSAGGLGRGPADGNDGASELSSRWAQYETDSLAEESRVATSNAAVDVATRLADRQAESVEGESLARPYNYNSRSNAGASTKDYVKGRLSTLLSPSHRNSTRNSFGSTHSHEGKHANQATSYCDDPNDYDKVRSEAIKMLQIADRMESASSPANGHTSSKTFTAGLFQTKGGGYAMREFDVDEWDQRRRERGLSPSNSFRDRADGSSDDGSPVDTHAHVHSSIAGLEKYAMEQPNLPQYDGTFAVDSHDEQDPTSIEYIDEDHTSEKSKSSWSSRYSVERQLMAITGGLDSRALCDKMDRLHQSHSTRSAHSTSARGMFRSSPAAMDGNNMDYDDYTSNSSTYGAGYGNSFGGHYWWNYVKGTLWSEIREENYDGTTQSLVRIEKRKRLRRRIWAGLIALLSLVVAVAVLVVVGNPKQTKDGGYSNASASGASQGVQDTERFGEVTFYVMADEPYDFADIRRLTLELESLPSDAEFLVHLGNTNSDAQSQCQEYGYERSANILKESPVPVFVLPGDVDWATCRKPERALQYWAINFGKFEENFQPHDFKVDHQSDRIENFAFLHRGVLFLSVHIVEAETDSIEWTTRHERNVMWTKEKLSQYEPSSYRALVIFGHAAPSSKQGEYFWPVVDQVKDLEKPVLYLHANAEGAFQRYRPFGEADNFEAVQLERRGEEAPMKVVVGMKGMDPFSFTRREPTARDR